MAQQVPELDAHTTAAMPREKEIKCGIVNWEPGARKPLLTLVCPPDQVFAPLRVYLKFSWRKVEDVPRNLSKILAPPRSQTKLVQTKNDVRVLLKVGEKGTAENGAPAWIAFNEFDGLVLDSE